MFRNIILAELERQGLSRYAIVEKVADRIPKTCTYDYLAGRTDMTGERLAILCKELGLMLKRSKQRRK